MSTASARCQDNAGEQVQGQHSPKSAQFRREKNQQPRCFLENSNETLKIRN